MKKDSYGEPERLNDSAIGGRGREEVADLGEVVGEVPDRRSLA